MSVLLKSIADSILSYKELQRDGCLTMVVVG